MSIAPPPTAAPYEESERVRRALNPRTLCNKNLKGDVFDFADEWYAAFGRPVRRGTWFVWGNSGNGKTSFTMQLCKELANHGKVLYVSHEEGFNATMQRHIKRAGMMDVKNFYIIEGESLDELADRLDKPRSPDIVIIDSVQYLRCRFATFEEKLKKRFPRKLFVCISQAKKNNPKGALANDILFDADQKINVVGFAAYNLGRSFCDADDARTDRYVIWEEGMKNFEAKTEM